MSFYKNIKAQQDNELYVLAREMSNTIVRGIFEDCLRKNIVSIKFATAYYSSYQNNVGQIPEEHIIGMGFPEEIVNKNINVQGYDFTEKTVDFFTDYIYKLYLYPILGFKEKYKEVQVSSPLILDIVINMTGYTQEYLDYQNNVSRLARGILYIKDNNGVLIPVQSSDVDNRVCPQIEYLSVRTQGLYLNYSLSEPSTFNNPARIISKHNIHNSEFEYIGNS